VRRWLFARVSGADFVIQVARYLTILAMVAAASSAPARAGDEIAPYTISDANAGTTPVKGDSLYLALHQRDGIERIVTDLLARSVADPRISDIFRATDMERLNRLLTEQICYISGGPCHYTGRDMKTAHTDLGLQNADMNALIENLELAMDKEKVPFRDQNRLLAKLAPMQRVVVQRR
jgi:hemoglobin